jgi:proton-coupled amino acid transporter
LNAAIVISQIGFCCAYVIFLSQNISHYLAGCYEDEEITPIDQISDDADYVDDADGPSINNDLQSLQAESGSPNAENSDNNLDNITLMQQSLTPEQQRELVENCEIVAKSYQNSIVLICLIPLLLLCQVRHLNRLAIFSLLADFANVFAYLIVFWFDFEHVSKVTIHPKEMDFLGLPFFMSVSMYCYEGAGMILALEESVHPDFRSRFKQIFSGAMVAITMLYIIFGVSGYLSFGPDTRAIITLNLPAGVFPGIVKACLCFSLFFTFPIMMFPVVETMERRLKIYSSDRVKGTIIRCISPIIVALIVLLIPSFSAIMGLIGATCCSLLAFILPALFHQKLFKGTLSKKNETLNYTLLSIGVIGAILGTHDALKRIMHPVAGGAHG